ncbi:MAG: hypothetical protein BWK74_03615 [Desulfobacteraceae bacterium A6]|nr:MAG: hypothetical protein BWK74_03615 [Desulfobacteraceae bacterium A6]
MGESGTLIKFGQHEHLLQLQDEGLLYLNNLPYFWKIEDEALRGDPFDSVARVERGPRIALTPPGGKQIFIEGAWTLRVPPPESEKINVFCMYALRALVKETFPVNQGNFRFGEHALALINPGEFMRRIESSLNSQGITWEANLVEYVDAEYAGEVGPFRKFKKFSYQCEWRLVCKRGPGNPLQIRIGSIRDISVIMRSAEVNKLIRVEFEQNDTPDRR